MAVGDKVSPDDFKVGDHVGYMMEAAQAEFTAVDTATAVRAPAGIEPGLTAAALLQGLTALTMVRESYPVKKVFPPPLPLPLLRRGYGGHGQQT